MLKHKKPLLVMTLLPQCMVAAALYMYAYKRTRGA